MVVFVVKRYAVREVKKWRYAVRNAKIKRYAVRKGGGGCHPLHLYLLRMCCFRRSDAFNLFFFVNIFLLLIDSHGIHRKNDKEYGYHVSYNDI